MAKYVIELLFTPKSEELEVTSLLEKLTNEFQTNEAGVYEFKDELENLVQDFSIKYNHTFDSLKVEIHFEKKGRITIQEARTLEKVALQFQILSRTDYWNADILHDDVSKFFQNKLNSLFYDYENSIRRLIYMTLIQTGQLNFQDAIPEETINDVKKRLGQRKKDTRIDNILQQLTLSQIEDYLFSETYIAIVDEDGVEQDFNFGQVEPFVLLSIIGETTFKIGSPYSIWSKYFQKYNSNKIGDISKLMELLRNARNTIGHFKIITFKNYNQWKIEVKKFTKEIKQMAKKVEEDGFAEADKESIYIDLETIVESDSTSIATSVSLSGESYVSSNSNSFTDKGQAAILAAFQKLNVSSTLSDVSSIVNKNQAATLAAFQKSDAISVLSDISSTVNRQQAATLAAFQKLNVSSTLSGVSSIINKNQPTTLAAFQNLNTSNALSNINSMVSKQQAATLAAFQKLNTSNALSNIDSVTSKIQPDDDSTL